LTDGTTTRFRQEDYDACPPLQTYMIQTGYAAMDIEGSWQFWVITNAKETNDINLGFWPYPSGSQGLFPPTILDYQCVSSQTLYPEAAYLLAKWMTFGQDGWNARLTLLEEDRAADELADVTPRVPRSVPGCGLYPVSGIVSGRCRRHRRHRLHF
jgi:multiple sugar transport system substrate-binding protein